MRTDGETGELETEREIRREGKQEGKKTTRWRGEGDDVRPGGAWMDDVNGV